MQIPVNKGYASLYDNYRSGAPSKLKQVHFDRIKTWVEEEALTGSALVEKM